MGSTTTRGFYKPSNGEVGWDVEVNNNFDILEDLFDDVDTDVSSLSADATTKANAAQAAAISAASADATTKANAAQAAAIAAAAAAQLIDSMNVVAAAGTGYAIPDVDQFQSHRLTLTAASCAITFPTAAAGKGFLFALIQDGTGSRVVTYPAGTKFPGGTQTTLSTGAGKVDQFFAYCGNGTNFNIFTLGLDIR